MTTQPTFRADFKPGEGGKYAVPALHGPLDNHTRRKEP